MSSSFDSYAYFYDLIYQNRDYSSITKTTVAHLEKYGVSSGQVLDLGCGTGTQSLFFEKMGYTYVGVDQSPAMIRIAKEKYPAIKGNFIVSEISKLNLGVSFEAIVSLFHVLSYQTTSEQLKGFFNTVKRHMNVSSVALIDFWSGPAVLRDGPKVSLKKFGDDDRIFQKTVTPMPSSSFPVFDLEILVEGLNENSVSQVVKETHSMRCFFADELEEIVLREGLKIVESSVHDNDWNGYIILQKRADS